MRKLLAFLFLTASVNGFSGEGEIPPELPPQNQSKVTPMDEEDLAPAPAPAPSRKPVKTVVKQQECGPTDGKSYIEGKCVCEQKPCKERIVEKKVYVKQPPKIIERVVERPVEKTVVKYKNVDRVVEKTVDRPVYVDRPVEKVVEKVVEKNVETNHSLLVFYGKGPDGVAPVLYRRRDGRNEYKAYQEYGNIVAGQYIYSFRGLGVRWNLSGIAASNETYMGGAGFSF